MSRSYYSFGVISLGCSLHSKVLSNPQMHIEMCPTFEGKAPNVQTETLIYMRDSYGCLFHHTVIYLAIFMCLCSIIPLSTQLCSHFFTRIVRDITVTLRLVMCQLLVALPVNQECIHNNINFLKILCISYFFVAMLTCDSLEWFV